MGWKDRIEQDSPSSNEGSWRDRVEPDTQKESPQLSADSVFQGKDKYESSPLHALLTGASNMGGLGLPRIGAAGLSAAASVATGETPLSNIGNAYRNAKNDLKEKEDIAARDYPNWHTAGQLGGAIIPAVALGGGGAAPTLANTMRIGAIAGGVSGFTGSPAEVTKGEILPAVKDTIEGAGLGMGFSALTHGLLNKLSPSNLEEVAKNRVVKAIGANKPQIQNLLKKKIYDKAGNILEDQSQFDEFAQRIFKNKIIGPLSTAEDALVNFQSLKQKSGDEIEEVISLLGQKAKPETLPNPSKAIAEIETQLEQPLLNPQGKAFKTTASQNNVVNNILEDLESLGNKGISFKEAHTFKQMLKQVAYNARGEVVDENAHKAYGIINRWIEDAADDSAKAAGIPGLLEKYIEAKKNYSTANLGETIALGKTAASMANRDFGLTDYISAAAGAAAHGFPGGAMAAGVNKLAKVYGNPLLATVAKGASDLFKMPKQVLQSLAQSMMSKGEAGQKFGKLLMEAAERDDVGKNALLFTLMQQSPYRKLYLDEQGTASTEGRSNVGQ